MTLIPTPIDEYNPLEQVAFNLLKKAALEASQVSCFVIEDLKPARRRWLRWGLPRDTVDKFITYNEHNAKESALDLIDKLRLGNNVYLMSDGGLPAFCDPGRALVELCHKNKIKVTATPFSNSVILALALSGFPHEKFYFGGFPPKDKIARNKFLLGLDKKEETIILMDTPYRLKRLIEELIEVNQKQSRKREYFLALDLNSKTEELFRMPLENILSLVKDWKREFILILK